MSKIIQTLDTIFKGKGGFPELWKDLISILNSKSDE